MNREGLKDIIPISLVRIDTAAREALTDMPPRNVNELDPITLHNLAIMNMEEDPSGGFEKLTFLIGGEAFPQETFVNLCLLYLKYEVSSFDRARIRSIHRLCSTTIWQRICWRRTRT